MFRRTILLLSAALLASVFLSRASVQAGKPAPPPPTGPRYLLYWVASSQVDGVTWSQPRGMNEAGDVVGLACWPVVPPYPDPDHSGENWEVFVFSKATGEMRNLNDIAGAALPEYWRLIDAGDMNNAGQIVGNAEYRREEPVLDENGDPVIGDDSKPKIIVYQAWGAFYYTPPSSPEGLPDLRILDYLSLFNPRSINDWGVTVLEKSTESGIYPAVYTGDGEPSVIPGPIGGTGVWRANAINLSGKVAGNARIGNYVNAVRYTPGVGTVSLGWLKNPGRTPIGQANDINDNGQVTGWTTTGGGNAGHAFRYTDGTGMKDLGTLGTSNTKGYGINNFGDVVGDATDSYRAFLYTNTFGMVDLKAAIDSLPPAYAQMQMQAWRINDAGWILGSFGGSRGQVCLLVPK